MFFLRDALDCENLGVTVVDADPGWTGTEHDHADGGHEEVYLVVEGSARLVVDGEPHDLPAGHAVRVEPGATRRLEAGDDGARLVLAGAP